MPGLHFKQAYAMTILYIGISAFGSSTSEDGGPEIINGSYIPQPGNALEFNRRQTITNSINGGTINGQRHRKLLEAQT